jgi:glycosyltransferase involved in cell wall biosynthesis
MKPLLSVIIPVYRVEHYLHECVDSVLSQTYTNLEVILVDDGSPDNCPALCDEYAGQDNRIRVIHQSNQGLSAARNAGLDIATGQFIAFVDSDDLVSPDYFEAALSLFDSCPDLDLVELPLMARFNTADAVRHAPTTTDLVQGRDQVFTAWFHHQGYLRAYSQLKVYRRHLFKEVRFPVGVTFEDLHIITDVLNHCQAIAFLAHPTANYLYRWRNESITVQAKWKDLDSQVSALERIGTAAEQHSDISHHDWCLFTISASNVLIDCLRASRHERLSLDSNRYQGLKVIIEHHKPKLLDICTLTLSAKAKAKATLLAILNVNRYLRLFR